MRQTNPTISRLTGWLRMLGVACLSAVAPLGVVAADPLRVDVYYSADVPVQQQVVEALSQALKEGHSDRIQFRLIAGDPKSQSDSGAPRPDLHVSVGSAAARRLAESDDDVPRLYAFLPQLAWQELRSCCAPADDHDSALLIDRSFDQQLQLVKSLLPSTRRLGILLGPASGALGSELAGAASAKNIVPVFRRVDTPDGVGPALRDIVRDVDALLALPDPVVFNRDTLYAILLTTYSANLPLFGYSQGLVSAGAAAALHLSPQDAAVDLAQAIKRFARTGRLDPPGASPSSSLAINRKVLRALGIDPAGVDAIQRTFVSGGEQ